MGEPEGAAAVAPLRRHSARVIVVDARDRVLLLRGGDPARPEKVVWHTPGGGVEDGEDEVVAARRELAEETGLVVRELAGPVWTRRLQFSFDRVPYDQSETFYFVRVDRHDVDTSGHTQMERRYLSGHRWWSLDELRSSDELIAPPDMAGQLEPLLRAELPSVPVPVAGAVLP